MKFVAIDGVEERMPKGFSFCNRVEAMACVDYIKFLVENKGVLPGHIGVISPYNHQSKLIVEELRKHKTLCGPEIIVNSVERFQVNFLKIIYKKRLILGFGARRNNHDHNPYKSAGIYGR